jgi:hypothetical protein
VKCENDSPKNPGASPSLLGLYSITYGLITNCCDYQKARRKHNTLLFPKSENEYMREVLATFFLVIFSFNGDYL